MFESLIAEFSAVRYCAPAFGLGTVFPSSDLSNDPSSRRSCYEHHKKTVGASLVLLLSVLSQSGSAAELQMKDGVSYNGGLVRGGAMCSVTLIESHRDEIRVEISMGTGRVSGPAREFVLTRSDAQTFFGKGSLQRWSWPQEIRRFPSETLSLKLNSDGQPSRYTFTAPSQGVQEICAHLRDAPY